MKRTAKKVRAAAGARTTISKKKKRRNTVAPQRAKDSVSANADQPSSSPAAKTGSGAHGLITRWGGHEVLARDGFVPVVVTYLKNAGQLKPHPLSPVETLFVLQLMVHKWDARAPHPSFKTLATRMGISLQYARRIARDLETKGYLRRRMRVGTTTRFDLTPLFAHLASHVQSIQQQHAQGESDINDEPDDLA